MCPGDHSPPFPYFAIFYGFSPRDLAWSLLDARQTLFHQTMFPGLLVSSRTAGFPLGHSLELFSRSR